ncbi:MAG: amidohydrolase family protein [Planctomycetaceae bacterium]
MTEIDWSRRVTLAARWVIPGDGRVLSPGCIELDDGVVSDLYESPSRQLSASDRRREQVVDLGDAAIIPALINAHTHLEFSDLASPVTPACPFAAWIRQVIATRRRRVHSIQEAVQQGWAEVCRAGGGFVGEICTDNSAADELQRVGCEGVIFRELLGLSDEAIEKQMEFARQFLQGSVFGPGIQEPPDPKARILKRGLSPHAPYSVHPELFVQLIEFACETSVPVAMHLAETTEELQLLTDRSGPLVDLFEEMGLWRPQLFEASRRPKHYLDQLAETTRALVVHGNYLDESELRMLVEQKSMTLVYCPRTHHQFGHRDHPWLKLRKAGGRVVIGTDSRASNPDLNLFAELQWLHSRHPEVAPLQYLKMVTVDAATALGLPAETGSLFVGMVPRLAVVRWPESRGPVNVTDLLTGGIFRQSTLHQLWLGGSICTD